MSKILIVGSGGREHAFAWKLTQSPKVKEIFIAPGNGGTAQAGKNVDIQTANFEALIDFAKKEKIDLTVVGPDDPLAGGIVDAFQNQGLKIWGPSKEAAQIESSKAFAKELMSANNIPTAKYKVFANFNEAVRYVLMGGARGGWNDQGGGTTKIVIKASGLALGKGVAVCQDRNEAKKFLEDVMVKKIFGDSGSTVVIEEFLPGMEFSVHAFSDGKTFQLLPPSQDHKAVHDNDKGPNTGGMGTIAPLPWVKQNLMNEVASRIVKPALDGLRKLDAPFVGLLYPGLVMTVAGPKTLEFNARFGDPETQSYMRLLKTDLFDILMASVDGKLDKIDIAWENKYACCVVLASGGYPGEYKKSLPITGVNDASELDDIVVFHAGTTAVPPPNVKGGEGGLYTNGGRVLGVTAVGDTLSSALDKAYSAIKLIHFDGMHYRTDIGAKSLLMTINYDQTRRF